MTTITFLSILFIVKLILVGIAVMAYDKSTGSHWGCRWFGWHNGKGGTLFTIQGTPHPSCSKCGCRVSVDSQGNWFEI